MFLKHYSKLLLEYGLLYPTSHVHAVTSHDLKNYRNTEV